MGAGAKMKPLTTKWLSTSDYSIRIKGKQFMAKLETSQILALNKAHLNQYILVSKLSLLASESQVYGLMARVW